MTPSEQTDSLDCVEIMPIAERIAEVADWIERDRREPDKVLCALQSLRRLGTDLLAGVYSS